MHVISRMDTLMPSIITVERESDLRRFTDLQYRLYSHRSPAQPIPGFEVRRLLDVRRNPALRSRTLYLLMALHEGKAVARCTLLPPCEPGGIALFGFFECVNDASTVAALLGRAEALCLEHGASALHGPFSPTRSGITGVQLNHFGEKNLLNEACSPPYYARLLEGAGYHIERRGNTWRNLSLLSSVHALATSLPDRNARYHIRQVGLRDLATGINDLAEVFEAAFRQGWGREPLSSDEYFYSAEFLLPAFRPDSFSLVCDESRPVGALLCFPDISPALRCFGRWGRLPTTVAAALCARLSRTLIAFAIGIHPAHQNSAAALILSKHFAHTAGRYREMYSTWITEGNTASERMARRFGLAPWKSFAVYRKDL